MQAQVQQVTHEAERVARAVIVQVAAWVIVFSAVLAVVAVLLFNTRTRGTENTARVRMLPRPGAVVSNVRTDLFSPRGGAGQMLKAQQRHRLESYGWVDRERGLVRIPVEVAIDLELAESRP